MRKRLSKVLVILFVLMMAIPTGAIAANDLTELTYEATKRVVAEKATLLTETYGTTSVQYALIDDGKIVLSGNAGRNDLEGKRPLTKDTMYGIGSTSKVFVTAAVMKLVDEGKIDLDQPVVDYIPDFRMKDERYMQITPRMLLNHSSGLPGGALGNSLLFEDNDTYAHDTLLERLAVQSLKVDPGAFSVYCNDGFTLAEILVERVSGMDYTSFIHKFFTEPLGLKHTKTPMDKIDTTQMAAIYHPTFQGQLPNESVNVLGTGGLYSTAEDLVRFSQIFIGEEDGILSDQSVRAMEQEEYKKGLWTEEADNSVAFGLGWDSVNLYPFNDYGIKALSKGGDTFLFHASLVVLPEHNMAAAVLSSGGSSIMNQVLASEILLSALHEKGTIEELKPGKSFGEPNKADMPKEMIKNTGYYGAMNQLVKIVVTDEGELSVNVPQIPDYPEMKYIYTADGSFVSLDGSEKAEFVTMENGRTYLWVRSYITFPGLGQIALSQFSVEKLSDHELSAETAEAWLEREGKKYYLLNEKYTSAYYLFTEPKVEINRDADLPGYLGDRTITGPNTAVSKLHIPLMGSRDAMEYRFYEQDGIEYLDIAGSIYVREEMIQPLYTGTSSKVTIQPSGYAKWYSIPVEAAGKTITVRIPKEASFAVYDEQGVCVNFSVATDINEVVLPQNGMIVFMGKVGSKFNILLK